MYEAMFPCGSLLELIVFLTCTDGYRLYIGINCFSLPAQIDIYAIYRLFWYHNLPLNSLVSFKRCV